MSVKMLRALFFGGGLIVLALGVACTIKGSALGVGSWDVLHIGLANYSLTIGTWSIITGFIILLLGASINKEIPKIGTWINMLSVGLFIDFFNWLLPDVEGLVLQTMMFFVGIMLLGFGCGMYIIANFGAGPRDSLMILLTQKLGWSVTKARTVIEVTVAIVGFAIGGPVGIGTLFMAVGLGPIIQRSLKMNEKLLASLSKQPFVASTQSS